MGIDTITLETLNGFELLLNKYNYKLKSPEFELKTTIDLKVEKISENAYHCSVLADLDGRIIETEFYHSFATIYNLMEVFYKFALNFAEHHQWDEMEIFDI